YFRLACMVVSSRRPDVVRAAEPSQDGLQTRTAGFHQECQRCESTRQQKKQREMSTAPSVQSAQPATQYGPCPCHESHPPSRCLGQAEASHEAFRQIRSLAQTCCALVSGSHPRTDTQQDLLW